MEQLNFFDKKVCSKCGIEKPLSEFYKDKQTKDGRQAYCKGCRKACYQKGSEKYRRKDPIRFRVGQIKSRCKSQGIPFDLTVEYIQSIDTDVCPYLGKPIKWNSEDRRSTKSIDRINPHKGYIQGNVEITSQLGNMMKQDATPDQLGTFCVNVLRRQCPTMIDALSNPSSFHQ